MTNVTEPLYVEQRAGHRTALWRRALLLTPIAILATGLLLYAINNPPGSLPSIVMAVILGIGALAVDIEAVAVLRDIRATPIATRGPVGRVWSKPRYLIVGRVHYMLVGRALFEIGAPTADTLHSGAEVTVEHWPHSHLVISIARTPAEHAPR